MTITIRKLLAGAALLSIFGCSKRADEPKTEALTTPKTATETVAGKSGTGLGVVQKISADRKFIDLDHNDIPGIMEAMAMEYPVQTPDLLNNIHEKDSVGFTLTKTPESQYMVTEIHKK